jgi:hypothetical protein
MFIWQLFNIGILSEGEKTIEYVEGYDQQGNAHKSKSVSLETVISRLKTANIKWVVIKLGDSDAFWNREKSSIEGWLKAQKLTLSDAIDVFHSNGMQVLGFHYVYGYDRWGISTEAECAKQIIESGVDGYVVDAEFEVETLVNPTPTQAMETFFEEISKSPSFSGMTIGYTTYGELTKHFRLPYAVFEKYCDVFIPQTYWVDRDPNCKVFSPEIEIERFGEDLRINREGKHYKLTKSGSDESIILAGSVESQSCTGGHAKAEDIVRFKDIRKKTYPTGECWWSLDWMNDKDLSTIGTW